MRYFTLYFLTSVFTVTAFPAMAAHPGAINKLINDPIFLVGLVLNSICLVVGCIDKSRLMMLGAGVGFCGIIMWLLLVQG